jgi:hypothetical protein
MDQAELALYKEHRYHLHNLIAQSLLYYFDKNYSQSLSAFVCALLFGKLMVNSSYKILSESYSYSLYQYFQNH